MISTPLTASEQLAYSTIPALGSVAERLDIIIRRQGGSTMPYSFEEVSAAFNSAIDSIDAEVLLSDKARDAFNLLTNVGLAFLSDSADDVRDAISQNYTTDPDEVLGWVEA
jgi:hypothetical protein